MLRALMGFGRWTVLDCTKIIMTKFWIVPDGTLHPVGDDLSHEEWGQQHGHELEELLDAGYLRVQAIIPPYLYLDFRRRLTAAQTVAVRKLFEDRFDQIVVEFGGVASSFTQGEEAMRHVLECE